MTEQEAPVCIFNQAHGPLLRDFAEAVLQTGAACTVCTGSDWEKRSTFPSQVAVTTAPPLNRNSSAARLLSWLTYSIAACLPLLRCNAHARLIFFTNPPILPVLGWLCSLIRGYKYSVVVYDIYPDILAGLNLLGERHPLMRAWRGLNRLAYENAFAVITLGEGMTRVLAQQFDAARTPAGRTIISRTWVNTAVIRPLPKSDNPFAIANGQAGRLTVLYSGNLGATHEIQTILSAAKLLTPHPEIQFLFIGDGTGFQTLRTAARDLENVTVLPWQPEEQVPHIWAAAEIAFITLRPGLERYSFPSKTAFALSAGCALIGITETPSDLADIITRTGCGVVVRPGDTLELVRCLMELAQDPALLKTCRTRARAAAEELFAAPANIEAMLMGVPGPEIRQ